MKDRSGFQEIGPEAIRQPRTFELSVGGAAILGDDGKRTGSVVTVLIAQPLRQGWTAPKTLKALGQVVWPVKFGGLPRFRHGLSVIRGDSLHALENSLQAAAGSDSSGGADGRLASPKRLAQAKRAAEIVPGPRYAIEQRD
jgi:hypothetical protein